MKTADYWIEKLNLKSHPEGGYFCEVYRSDEIIADEALPGRYSGGRCFSTSIYFLIKGSQVSKFHRLRSDEIWHFYYGSPIVLHIISNEGKYKRITLGQDPEKGESLQVVIQKESWFGAEVSKKNSYALSGCSVAPGFEFIDFEMGDRENLLELYPEFEHIISILT